MPISPHQNLLCSYRYDALDRSINWTPIRQAAIQRFHCKNRLATEIQDSVKHSVFQHDDHVLAQQQHTDDQVDITLLTTHLQGSVLNALDAHRLHPIAYMPYGHRLPGNGLLSLLGFNGERPDPVTGHYHLGHGYRQFNPVLMRFNSPDSLSPFGKGGLNAYAYCCGNPVLNIDPTGQTIENIIRRMGNNVQKITGRNTLHKATINAIENLPPKYTRLENSSLEAVINKLLKKNRVNANDKKVFDDLAKENPEVAARLLSEVKKKSSELFDRLEIVTDAVDGSKNRNLHMRLLEETQDHTFKFFELKRRMESLAATHKSPIASVSHGQNPSSALELNTKNVRQPEVKK